MENQEFPKQQIRPQVFPKGGFHKQRFFTILKFIIVLFLLPWIFAFTVSFLSQSRLIESTTLSSFWYGVISFLAAHLFVYEMRIVYNKGQKITEGIFRFFSPLVRLAPFVLPIYTILLFLIYCFLSLFTRSFWLLQCFMFLFGFSFSLHLVLSAKSLQNRQRDFFKINYFFAFFFVYIINVILLASMLSILFGSFSSLLFFKQSYQITRTIFSAIFCQLF